jgi:membrane protein DedA with SNARE-associated domain
MPLASITSTVTSLLEHHGALAVFVILAIDAVLPVGGELPMVLSGAVAAGAIGHGSSLLGIHVAEGVATYVVLATSGTLGYVCGSIGGWYLGRRGGRELIERHGPLLHLGPSRMRRAERWFSRFGQAAILLGRVTPLVRSFISVTAGVLRAPFGPYLILTVLGSAVWCFGLAALGWAIGARWSDVHDYARTLDFIVLAVAAVLLITAMVRHRRPKAP